MILIQFFMWLAVLRLKRALLNRSSGFVFFVKVALFSLLSVEANLLGAL